MSPSFGPSITAKARPLQRSGHDVSRPAGKRYVSTLRGGGVAARAPLRSPRMAHFHGSAASLRLLVVTGGHEYATPSTPFLKAPMTCNWAHAVSNHEAVSRTTCARLRRAGVYDFSQDISDTEKTNLRDFRGSRAKESWCCITLLLIIKTGECGTRRSLAANTFSSPKARRPPRRTSTIRSRAFESSWSTHYRHIGAMHLWDENL